MHSLNLQKNYLKFPTLPVVNKHLSIYIYFACLFVSLCLINIKTAEPIGPKFCLGPSMTTGKVLNEYKIKILKIHEIFYKIRELFACFCCTIQCKQRENVDNGNKSEYIFIFIYTAC